MFVLTIDQHGSTAEGDRVPELLAALEQSAPRPVLGFERTAGDEVQGLLAEPAVVLDSVRAALRLGGWQVGVGTGPVDRPLPPSTRSATGTAYYRAREAVERAKSRRLAVPVALVGAGAAAEPKEAAGADRHVTNGLRDLTGADAEALLQLLGTLVQRRSAAGWEAIDAVVGADPPESPPRDSRRRQPPAAAADDRSHAGHPSADDLAAARRAGWVAAQRGTESRARADCAQLLGISEQALSNRLRVASWTQEHRALATVVRVLEEADR